MNFFLLVISSLASYRLALMFSHETGPGAIFKTIRQWQGLNETLRDGIECLLCESVWWAGLITVYLSFVGHIGLKLAPIFWLACSAAACIIHFLCDQDEPNDT